MRRNTKKFKPNPSSSSRHSIRSSLIRDIIGDRRFNAQLGHVNAHGTEGINKVKSLKVGDAEADDLPNLGQNVSSSQCEAAEDPTRCCGDFAAKTSEFAFFKRMKKTASSNTHMHPKYHDNQLNNAQESDISTKEEIPNVQKESIKYARPSSPVEKEQDDAHYALLTPVYKSKNSEVTNVLGVNDTNVQKVTPGEYNWLAKTSGSKGVFSMKRENLCRSVADKSSYDVNELSSKGIDLVSALINRILPEDQENNCEDEPNSKYKLPSFSESETATLFKKGDEANKRKFIESHDTSYLNDDFPRSLEWNPNGSESSFSIHAPKFWFQYDHYHSEAYKTKWFNSHHISYSDDNDLPKSSDRVTDMDILEWNPNHSESSKTSSQYDDCCYSESYKRKRIESPHISSYLEDRIPTPRPLEWNPTGSKSSIWYNYCHTEDGFRIPNLGVDRYDYECGYLKELEDDCFDNEHKSLEQQPWQFETEMNTFSTSQDDDDAYQFYMHVDRHFNKEHDMSSLIIPYTPKHVMMPVEDCSINNHAWCLNLNECFNEKEDVFMGDGVKSNSYMMEGFDGKKHFDDIGYPLLLGD